MSNRPEPPEGYVWMAVTKEVDADFYRFAHLVRTSQRSWDKGWQDTRCGASSGGGFTTRAASGKPCCETCLHPPVYPKKRVRPRSRFI